MSRSPEDSPAAVTMEPQADFCVVVQAERVQKIQSAGLGVLWEEEGCGRERKKLSGFNIDLRIKEAREHEEETCSFGKRGSV